MYLDLAHLTAQELLTLYSETLQELSRRRVIVTQNAPLGDYCELLICEIFGWNRTKNSKAGIDAIAPDQTFYQIKSRRLIKGKSSRQLSPIRDIDNKHFHYLVGVLFNDDYSIYKAAMLPHQTVKENSKYYAHTNSWIFHLRDSVWSIPSAVDITSQVKDGLLKLDPMTMTDL